MKARTWLVPLVLAVSWSLLAQEPQPAEEKEKQQQRDQQNQDDAVIRLDATDPNLNRWKQIRDMSKDVKRDPGPINIQRFAGGMGWQGIPTFFNLPVALTPEDLKAGKVHVALLGAPLDMGSGMRGAAFGPRALRTSETYLSWGAYTNPHLHVMVDWNKELHVVDYGDAAVDPAIDAGSRVGRHYDQRPGGALCNVLDLLRDVADGHLVRHTGAALEQLRGDVGQILLGLHACALELFVDRRDDVALDGDQRLRHLDDPDEPDLGVESEGECGRAGQRLLGQDRAVEPEHLGEDVLGALGAGTAEADLAGPALLELPSEVVDAGPQGVVDRAAEVAGDPQVHERAGEDEDDRHRDRERDRDPRADRQPTQDGAGSLIR